MPNNKNKTENGENIILEEDVQVETEVKADMDFNYQDLEPEKMEKEELISAFEKLKNQNLMLLNVLKTADSEMKELKAKSVSRVSEEQFQRLAADFENHKRRSVSVSATAYADGKIDVLKDLVGFVDNFERGLAMVTDENSKKGIELIHKACLEIFSKNKIEEINPIGEAFDPELHNAVMQAEAENEEDDDKVVEVFQKGYKTKDKVLRYAQVKVAKS